MLSEHARAERDCKFCGNTYRRSLSFERQLTRNCLRCIDQDETVPLLSKLLNYKFVEIPESSNIQQLSIMYEIPDKHQFTSYLITCDNNHTYVDTLFNVLSGKHCFQCLKATGEIERELVRRKYTPIQSLQHLETPLIDVVNDKSFFMTVNIQELIYLTLYDFQFKFIETDANLKITAIDAETFTCNNYHSFKTFKHYLYPNVWCPQCMPLERCVAVILNNLKFKLIWIKGPTVSFECDQQHVIQTDLYTFISKHHCSACGVTANMKPNKQSKGEKLTGAYLTSHNLIMFVEHTFNDLNKIGPYRFDFYLIEIKTLLEFDGDQHFRAVTKFGGQRGHLAVVASDIVKEEYCLKHKKRLLRINRIKEIEYDINMALTMPDNIVMMTNVSDKISKYPNAIKVNDSYFYVEF